MLPHVRETMGIVILGAGKGTRLHCVDRPKVMVEIGGRPMVSYIVETVKKLGFFKQQICIVVGFRKERVTHYFRSTCIYAYQTEQLGTAHAAYIGMRALPESVRHILVMGGDDSAFYTPETLDRFMSAHASGNTVLSLLSVDAPNPASLGRVIRDADGGLLDVLEKEEVGAKEQQIHEVSTGTYCFNRQWFQDMFMHMPLIPKLGEYGLPASIRIAKREDQKIQVMKLEHSDEWFGVNTPEELAEADRRKNAARAIE